MEHYVLQILELNALENLYRVITSTELLVYGAIGA